MNALRVLGSVAVLLIAVGLGGVLASLVTENPLFIGTGDVSATPAIAALLVFVIALFAFIAIGRPQRTPNQTPYW